jgi:ribosomal protein L29
MKKKEINNLRSKKVKELIKMLNKKRTEAMQIKAKLKVSKEKDLKKVKNLRRDIAQIKTVIREKELIGEEVKQEEIKKKENKKINENL